MKDFVSDTISHAIEAQFPGVYREDASTMVAFVKAYYEFLEETDKYSTKVSRSMFESNDIDTAMDEFLIKFKKKYLKHIPLESVTDTRFMNKHIMDLYRSKGSERSLELFMRLVYNEAAEIYYPGRDIIRPSESKWKRNQYIEVSKNAKSIELVGREITSSKSGAKAFVESFNTKRVDGKLIDILYLSNIRGTFLTGERVTADGDFKGAPVTQGSLSDVDITLGGRNNVVGDLFEITGAGGVQGQVRVSGVADATGRVDFELIDGGYGYANTDGDFGTDIYVTDAMIENDNSDARYEFLDFEKVIQRIEEIELLSATDVNDAVLGDVMVGIKSGGAQVVEGVVISVANTDANGSIIGVASANSIMTLQVLDQGTFSQIDELTFTAPTGFQADEFLDEQSEITLNISANTGVFSVSDAVHQNVYDAANNLIDVNVGTVTSANDSVIVIEPAWGTYSTDVALVSTATPATTATIASVLVTSPGARGFIQSTGASTADVRVTFGAFNAGNFVRGQSTRLIEEILSIANGGAVDIHKFGDVSSNGVIDIVTENYAEGIVIGQNTIAVGLHGNTSPFVHDDAGTFFIETQREDLVSTPKFEWYDPVFGLDVDTDITEITVFDTAGLATDAGKTENDLRSSDAIFRCVAKLPDPLQDGVLFEIGDATDGFAVVIDDNGFGTGKALMVFAGANVANNLIAGTENAFISISEDDLNLQLRDEHEFIFVIDAAVGSINLYIDGDLRGSGSNLTGDWSTYWSGTGAGSYGKVNGAYIVDDQFNSDDWRGTLTSNLEFYSSTSNTVAVPGASLEFQRPIIDVKTGFGAGFDVGVIENVETVLLNTDMVGDNNVANVPFYDIRLDGQGSGYGFVDSITITDGGTQYANGSNVTFSGGGYAGGEPLTQALGTITTDGAGVITVVTMTVPGDGFYEEPTYILPATAGSTATLQVNMDFGYGFPKLPDGDDGTLIEDCLTHGTFDIGTIASMTRINPGADYNADPFVRPYNRYVAGYQRRDFYAEVSNVAGGFEIGETLEQVIGGTGTAKGKVAASFVANNGVSTILIERNLFNIAFQPLYAITGEDSGATAWVDTLYDDPTSRVLGDNADVTGTVIAANGIVTDVEVIDSGYGYIENEEVTLERDGFPFVVSGLSLVEQHGISAGHWETFDSHASSEKRIQDSTYYQEYSYDVISGISLNKYVDAVKRLIHVSGNEIYGSISKKSKIDSIPTVAESAITLE